MIKNIASACMDAPRRCFLCQVDSLITDQHATRLRLLGTLVSAAKQPSSGPGIATGMDVKLLLDDGTGVLVDIIVDESMIQAHDDISVGTLLECVVHVVHRESSSSQGDVAAYQLIAKVLIVRSDRDGSETLRWFEIAFDAQSCCNVTMDHGYPRESTENSDDMVLDWITAERNHGGVSLDDLVTMLDLSKADVQAVVQSLQLSGHIYQHNRTGAYMPL